MKWSKQLFISLYLFIAISLSSLPVWAAGGHAEGNPLLAFLAKVFNFLLVAAVLVYFGKKALPAFLSERSDQISEKLRHAEELEKEAKRLHDEAKQKLSELDAEIADIKKQAIKSAEQEKTRLIEQAKHEAEHVVASAKQSAERLEQRLTQQLIQQLTATAATRASEQLLESLAPESKSGAALQKQLLDRFITEVNEDGRQ